jgi:UV DNA damage endonuclease
MLGICCHFLQEETKPRSGENYFVNAMEERTLQLGRYRSGKYTPEAIKATYVNNVRNLANMLPVIRHFGAKHFRISSAMFPLSDQVDRELWDNDEVKVHLKRAGEFIREQGMRVTTHPGQFCVLSSDSDAVVENAFKELGHHGWFFDEMGLDHSTQYAINIHGGKRDRTSRLIEQIKSLPDNVRKRLTLENDETCYSVIDLLEVHKHTGTPICWDSHHHIFNDGELTLDEGFEVACATWQKGISPLQHIANTEPGMEKGSFPERRKHSNMIHYVPDCQLKALRDNLVDVEVEAKMKNISIKKMISDFQIPL